MSQSIRDRTSTIMRMAGNIAPAILTLEAQAIDRHDPLPSPKSIAMQAVDYAQAIVDEVLLRLPELPS